MKPLDDEVHDILRKACIEGAKAMLACMAYQGSDRRYLDNAKIGAAAVRGFTTARASEANRMQIEEKIAQRAENGDERE